MNRTKLPMAYGTLGTDGFEAGPVFSAEGTIAVSWITASHLDPPGYFFKPWLNGYPLPSKTERHGTKPMTLMTQRSMNEKEVA